MTDSQQVALLESGTRLLVRSVDSMDDAQWAAPSLLPGWSRAHVVAHLVLNAEALAGVLDGVHEGRAVPMYGSDAERDDDIDALAAEAVAGPAEVRARFLASTTLIGARVQELAPNLEDVEVERTPGGRSFAARDVLAMRVREVAIHHADLDLGHTAADWPAEFVALVLASGGARHRGPGFVVQATDLGQSWTFGDGGPTVSGTGSALAWWVTGRPLDQTPGGDGLTSDDGRVPGMEPW